MLVSTAVMVAFRVIRAQGSGFGAQGPWVGLWFVGSWYNEGAGVRTTDLGYNRLTVVQRFNGSKGVKLRGFGVRSMWRRGRGLV
jgi:hypothetical protein